MSVNREATDATIFVAVALWLVSVYEVSAVVFYKFEKLVYDLRKR